LIGDRLWQRGYYDHIVRDEKDLHRVRQYIDNNPLAWALDEENPNRRPPRAV
jgi:REP element-mobilizing transposase RayT